MCFIDCRLCKDTIFIFFKKTVLESIDLRIFEVRTDNNQTTDIMASIQDIIAQQVKNLAGGVEIPANVKDQVLNGLSNSIFGSLTQTALKPGGIDQITQLLTGKAQAATSPITALASNLFGKNIGKLGLGALAGTLTGLIPQIMGSLSGFIKDQDGDGDVDLQDVLATLKGAGKGVGGGLLGGLLGGIFKKR